MGQYYSIAYKRSADGKVAVNLRKVKGCGYIMAKLMEHSYFGNKIVDSIANILAKGKCRLAWVGDCAEDDEVKEITKGDLAYEDVWGDNAKSNTLTAPKNGFSYSGKYLVNWNKKEYLSFDKYLETQLDDLKISPIPLLTAIGNGRGGGDYHETNRDSEMVGSWAWDEISVEKSAPEGFSLRDVKFIEGRV